MNKTTFAKFFISGVDKIVNNLFFGKSKIFEKSKILIQGEIDFLIENNAYLGFQKLFRKHSEQTKIFILLLFPC